MSNRLILSVLVVVSVTLRIGAAVYLGEEVTPLPGTADQVSYHTLAQRVLDGHGFTFGEDWWPLTEAGHPTSHWSYIYTLYLTGVYTIVGKHALAARIVQAVAVGILQPVLAYLLGVQLFGKTVGIVSAAWMALYGYFIYYSATLMTEPFYITAILASLVIAIRIAKTPAPESRRSGSNFLAVCLGICLAVAVLLRQLFLLTVPFLLIWIAYSSRTHSGKIPLASVAITAGVILLLIAPVTAFNYTQFDQFILVNSNAGYAFFLSNHPVHGTEFITARDLYSYRDLYPPELLGLDEASLDKALLVRGIQFVLDDPLRFLRLSLSRVPIYFNFWPLAESELISNVTRVISFGLLLPFSILGIFRWAGKAREQGTRAWLADPGTLLLGIAFLYSFIHIVSWVQVRYRLPIDAILIPFAASGLVLLIQKIMVRLPQSVSRVEL